MSDYEHDFYLWTQAQAAALRAKDLAQLDLDHLAEEIESLGKRDRRGMESYLEGVWVPKTYRHGKQADWRTCHHTLLAAHNDDATHPPLRPL